MSGETDRSRRLAWFEELYRDADADPDNVPWSRSGPHPGLELWASGAASHGGKAVDVGCGLGDNAAFLAGLGYMVTAFDLSETAVAWARQRFAASGIDFAAADLFDLPKAWTGAFDLVSEVYTLQALPADLRQEALRNIAALAAPGGRIAVVCMGREENETVDGPPWPLAPSELKGFEAAGFRRAAFTDTVLGENGRRHFVAEYVRP